MMNEKQKIAQWDYVDNAIFGLIQTLNPTDIEIKWNIAPIREIRDIIRHLLVVELKLCTEEEFYP